MTEIRGGGEQQGTTLVEGALRTVDRMGRALSRHLERVARDNERMRRERDEERANRSNRERDQRPGTTGDRARAYLGGANDPEVSRVANGARARVQPVGPRGVEVPLDGSGPMMPAVSINTARDARRIRPGGGATPTRGYGSGESESGRMLRVDYGDGPVFVANPNEREIIREVVENNPRAFPSFGAWVNAVMGLRNAPLDSLTAERLAMARREFERGGPEPTSRAVPPDAPITEEELQRGAEELRAIMERNAVGRSRSETLDRARSLANSDLLDIPSILRGPVRRALVEYDSWRAEGEAVQRMRDVERGNRALRDEARGPIGADGRPRDDSKSDRRGAKQNADTSAVDGVSFDDPETLPGATTPTRPETNSRTLAITRPPDGQSRMDRLEDRIRQGPLAPLAGAAAVAGGEEVPLGSTGLSVDREGRVRGSWRW